MTPKVTVEITDRNETKFHFAKGFIGTPFPFNANTLFWNFPATAEFIEARRAYSLNHSVPVLSFIAASRFVDKAIFDHKNAHKNNGRQK